MGERALHFALSTAWAIQPDALQLVLEIASRSKVESLEAIQALEAKRGEPLDNTRTVTVRNGVAVIPVTGPIFPRANLMTRFSGATSVALLAQDFQEALESDEVKGIILNIDSPGGQIGGINEFAGMVHAARGVKPVVAYVGGLGASAAYWIASAAEKIYTDPTGQLGSIGVIMAYTDDSMADAAAGVKQVTIVSSQSPKKGLEPNSSQGRQVAQDRVDALASIFVDTVARNRNVTVEKVTTEFGQGDTLIGADAVKAGLADGLASFEQVLAGMSGQSYFFPRQQINRRGPQGPGEQSETSEDDVTADDKGGEDMAMGWIQRLFAGATEQERKEALAALQAEDKGVAGKDKEQPAAGQVVMSAKEYDLLRTTASRVDNLEETIQRERAVARKNAAETFVSEEIRANRLLPAEKDAATAEYLRAALDDEMHPVAADESRVALLRERQTKRPAHMYTREMLSTDMPEDARMLMTALPEGSEENGVEAWTKRAEKYAGQINARNRANGGKSNFVSTAESVN